MESLPTDPESPGDSKMKSQGPGAVLALHCRTLNLPFFGPSAHGLFLLFHHPEFHLNKNPFSIIYDSAIP